MTNSDHPDHSARRGLHSETVALLPASGIRRFFELLDQATGVISLAVGQPDFATPAQITNAASEAMLAGHTGYTSNYGVPELREMLSRQLERLYGVRYAPEGELMLTSGVLRGARHRDARARRPRRRGAGAGAGLRRVPAGRAARGRTLRASADRAGDRLHGHRRGARGADHSGHEGDPARLPLEPHGRRPRPADAGGDCPHRGGARPLRHRRTRSTIASSTGSSTSASPHSRACGSVRSCLAASPRLMR